MGRIRRELKKTISLGVTIGGYDFNMPTFRSDITTLDGVLSLVADVLEGAIYFSAVVAVIMIIYAGYLYITASGDSERISTATKAITAAIMGMVIAFIAKYVIVFLIESLLI